MNHLNAGSGDDTFAKFSERYAAANEARLPALKKIKTHPGLDIIPLMTDAEIETTGAHLIGLWRGFR